MKMPYRLCFPAVFFSLILGIGGILHAQDEKKFQLYCAADGLSDNNITGIVQDEHGFMWIASLRGLNRYDGKRFIQFHADKSSNSLPDENLLHLFWLDKNRLAVNTGMGMHIINLKTGGTSDIIIPYEDPKYLYKFNIIMSALSDDTGNIYILTRSGFYHYSPDLTLKFRYDYYSKEETKTETFLFGNKLFWLSTHEVLLNTINGCYIYNTQTHSLNKIEPNHPLLSELSTLPHTDYLIRQTEPGNFIMIKGLADSISFIDCSRNLKVTSPIGSNFMDEIGWRCDVFKVNDSLFYFTSMQNGFFKLHLDRKTGRITIDPKRYFPGYLCNDFVFAKDRRMWIATNIGLLKEMNQRSSVHQVSIPANLLVESPTINIRQLYCYKNQIYAACAGNGGLLVFDKNTLAFEKKISFHRFGLYKENVFSILLSRPDTLLIGTDGPLFWVKASTGESGVVPLEGWDRIHNWISAQFKDSHGNIWVTTNENNKVYILDSGSNHFRRLDYDYGIFKQILVARGISEDLNGNIWMVGHGVCRFPSVFKEPDLYLDSFPSIRFPRRDISCIAFNKDNLMWLGVNNNGLASYDLKTKVFHHLTSNDGLPDNYIKAIYPIDTKLWIATATGIALLDLRTNSLSSFSSDDGFSQLGISSTQFYYDSLAHYIYCGFTDHIVRFDPDSILFAKSPPTFLIEGVHFLNDTTYYYPGQNITVPYYKNDITVQLGTINYNDVNNQRISYRIANADDNSWQPLLGDHINFNNLPPGHYQVQMKLYAANNRWREQMREINIIINPPFWKTPWFIAFICLLLLLFIYWIYHSNVTAVRKTERAKLQVQELKTEEYKYRLELEKISHYFSTALAGKKNIGEVLWGVAGKLIGEMGYEDCMIYLWNEDRTKMVQKAGYGPKGTPEAISRHVFEVKPGQGLVGSVMETKKALIVGDTRKDKRYRADEMFRLSEICVPIIHNGQLLGVIDSEHPNANFYKERDLKILTTIATLVGNKMKQMEVEESLAEKREELATINEQLAEAQLTALQTQMNPHFIFNALNSIKRMILDNENKSASRYLSKFAQMIRLTLNHSKETFVTLEETIEYLHAYLDMEQLRFGSSFSYKIETTGKSDEEDIKIPTLMIQPLAENAIWHGLMPKEGDKKIIIRFVQSGDMVTCTIEDNGIGIRQSEKEKQINHKQPSVGLDNLRKRIKIMNKKYDMHCSLDIIDLSERNNHHTGTLAILKFKLLT